MIKLINYADQRFAAAQKYNSQTGKEVGKVDEVVEYSPEKIDQSFIERNKKWFVVGDRQIGKYGLWRPLIVKDAYETLRDGDILMYADSGTYFVSDVHHLTDLMERENLDVLVFELPLIEKYWTKRDVFIQFDADQPEIVNSNQRMSTMFLLRKSKLAGQFVDLFFQAAIEHPELFTDQENICGKPDYSGFIQNRHNQSVLSVLTKRLHIPAYVDTSEYGKRPELYRSYGIPDYSFSTRKGIASPYPQIIVQHRHHKVTMVIKVMGWVRSYMPLWVGSLMISAIITLQSLRKKMRRSA